jgi:glycosyltransferase involved in cell wall biosynthesis
LKLTILWSSLASYSVAFFKELAHEGCNIQLIFQTTKSEAPYKEFDLSFCEVALEDSEEVKGNLEKLVNNFNPACVLMSSWSFPHFIGLAKNIRKRNVYVIAAMDNQWNGTLKQIFGVMSSNIFLKPSIDTFLVAGDRQAYFARKLGYPNVLYGLYAADINQFVCDVPVCQRHANFLFIGRVVSVKGVEELASAYLAYRQQVAKPWGLKVVGSGPLEYLLRRIPGVDVLGFVQPDGVRELMRDARCFVLPSRWEPWGVVIHEAAAAGLPIIASYQCGATTMFVRDGVNGYVVPPQVGYLTNAMVRMSTAPQTILDHMSIASCTLAKLWSPDKLAKYFIQSITSVLMHKKNEALDCIKA